MPLGNFFTSVPWPFIETLVKVVGFLGSLLLIYAILLEEEKRQDAVFVVGSACLLVYSLYIDNKIFSFLAAGIFLVGGRELVQIIRKKHFHSNELVEEYKHPDHK